MDTPLASANNGETESVQEREDGASSGNDESDGAEEINKEKDDDETPHSHMSISLSVSEVATAVLEGFRLEEMIARSSSGEVGENPSAIAVKVKEAKKPLRKFRKGPGVEAAARPSTGKQAAKPGVAKTKVLKGEKEAVTKTEVLTCARMDTPSGVGDAVGARFTFPRHDNEGLSDEEEPADRGESDGEGGAIPCVIPNRLALRPLTVPVASRGLVHHGDSRQPYRRRQAANRVVVTSKRKRVGGKAPSTDTRGKRKAMPSSSRFRPPSSSDGESEVSTEQVAQVMSREVTIQELEADRRALDQELEDLNRLVRAE